MVDLAANKSVDLSSDNLQKRDVKIIPLGLDEQAHRFSTEKTLFSSAISVAVLLYMTAIVMGVGLVVALQRHPDIHWHVSLLVASFIVPPTVIFVSLIRAVYKKPEKAAAENDDKPEDSSLPALGMMKDFAKEVGKEVAKEVSKVLKP